MANIMFSFIENDVKVFMNDFFTRIIYSNKWDFYTIYSRDFVVIYSYI